MNVSQDQLNAFYVISRLKSFTKSTAELGLTQSALSHRIRKLEEECESTLFIRASTGILLTEAGNRLLQFCRIQAELKDELLQN